MSEYDYEEVRGLPGRLPPDESILWQGAPDWRVLARRTFHVRVIAVYFAALIVVRGVASVVLDGATVVDAVLTALFVVPLALTGIALLLGLAYWHAHTTVYTITDRRVVLRFGVAIQLAINLPFREITGAALLNLPSGHGEIPLTLSGTSRLAYLHLWPHARPAVFSTPQPMLRCVPDGQSVAELLTEAWRAANEATASEADAPEATEAQPIIVTGPTADAPIRAAPAGVAG